jgi:catechol 2,3-dioxygenase-like lactoylglutathione lyase family enzyme
MAITGLDHVQLAIPAGGLEDEKRFFCEHLGMREVPRPANMTFEGCWLEGGSASLHIGVDPEFSPAAKAHPAFLVADARALRARLDAAGIATKDGSPVEGYERFFTSDPHGNRLEIMQKL